MDDNATEAWAAVKALHAEALDTRDGMLAELWLIPTFRYPDAAAEPGKPGTYIGPFGGSEPDPLARRAGELLREADDQGLDEALRTARMFHRNGRAPTARAMLALACLQGGLTEAGIALAATVSPRCVETMRGLHDVLREAPAPFDAAGRFVAEGRRDADAVLRMLDAGRQADAPVRAAPALTKSESEVFDFVRTWWRTHAGCAPTFDDIACGMDMGRPTVTAALAGLEGKGLILREERGTPDRPRRVIVGVVDNPAWEN